MANKLAKCGSGSWLKIYINSVEMNFHKSFRQALHILFGYKSVAINTNNCTKYRVSCLEKKITWKGHVMMLRSS